MIFLIGKLQFLRKYEINIKIQVGRDNGMKLSVKQGPHFILT